MVKSILKRFIRIMLVICIVFNLFPSATVEVKAATALSGLTDTSIGLSYNDGTWTASGTTINGSVTGTPKGTCDDAASKTSTLNIINNKTNKAQLSFDYTVSVNGGSISIDGNGVTAAGKFVKEIPAGDSIQISITSAVGEKTTSISVSNISLVVDTDVTTTFIPGDNGTFTVDGNAITEEFTNTQRSTIPYALVAKPATGYKFVGWKNIDDNSYYSSTASVSLYFESDGKVQPYFVSNDTAVFECKSNYFDNLGEAVDWATKNNGSKITLVSDGTISGNYTIPQGITLLIPYDAAASLNTTEPKVLYGNHTTPSVFRTLTMASGSSITVQNGGAICVNSQVGSVGTGTDSWNGTPTGKYGLIKFNENNSIVLENGSNLYVWGYISGDGKVDAKKGSTVYECFQIRDWRGGSATMNMNKNSQKVFPMSQYYVQNIESKLNIEAGAKEIVFTAINMSGQAYKATTNFIGEDGMFQVASGNLTKQYIAAKDRLQVDVNGDASISSISLNVSYISMNSSDYNLPINSNISININSGTTTINQSLALLPGTQMSVASGAIVNVETGKNIYVYDSEQWGPYVQSASKLNIVGYSVANGTKAMRTEADLVDSKVDINGAVNVNGAIYTTESGADICSSEGTGVINFVSGAGQEKTTYQATYDGSIGYNDITITSAKLHNGVTYVGTDKEYTLTNNVKANDSFTYDEVSDLWVAPPVEITVTFDKNAADATGEMTSQKFISGKVGKLNKNTFERPNYVFAGWNTMADGNGLAIEDEYEGTIDVTADLTLYAQWKQIEKVKVQFVNDDGTILQSSDVEVGKMPVYTGETPVKAADAQYTYTFAGWDKEIVAATEATTYTAVYDKKVNTYTVTWKNGDTVLKTDTLEYGATPSYAGETPTKEATAQYTYTFTGWTPEVVAVTGDATYSAEFSEKVNEYTIRWLDWNGNELASETYAYGKTPSYKGETPTREATAQYTYTFSNWTPEIVNVTGNTDYTAVYSQEVNKYTVTWNNYDGTLLASETYDYGATPTYKGETPTKEATAQYTYTFAGWDKELVTVTGDVTYTATFTSTVNNYTVTWVNDDGTELFSEDVAYGTIPSYKGEDPTKAADAQYTYTFTGWTPEVVAVTGAVTYKAVYTSTVNKYEVKWLNYDGTVLASETYEYGAVPSYKEAEPVKELDAGHNYYFAGWTPTVVAVSGNATYTATFTEELKQYTVTWVVDGKTVYTEDLDYGATPSYKGETPTKEATAQYTYTFKGWTPEVGVVVGDVTYTAVFTETVNKYEITWKNDEEVLKTEMVEYGTTPVYSGETPVKEATAQYTYTFKGWTPEVVTVTGAATYEAEFASTVNKYTVKWLDWNGDVLKSEEVEYGTVPAYSGTPSRAATAQYTYAFAGWTPEVVSVTEDASYTATYSETVNKYTVTWVNEDGSVLATETYEYGSTPVYPNSTPTKEATAQYTYTFAGWDKELVTVTGDVTYTATFTSTVNKYTVTWVNDDGTELFSEDVAYGTIPSYKGEDPTKAADAQYTYTFTGWTPEVVAVTGAVTYKAVYTSTVNKYEVKWLNYDGTVLASETYEYGAVPSYKEAEPVKELDAGHNYYFAGWTPTVVAVSGNATYTATFTEELKQYTVTWVVDGKTVYTEDLDYGATPSYKGETPTKEATAQYTYTFKGWTPEVGVVVGDVTYTAVFTETVNKYEITWKNDEEVLKTEMVEYGTTPVYSGETPVKEATAQYTYTFKGWTPEVVTVTGAATYEAEFTSTVNKYTVKWLDWNGDVLKSEEVEYGTVPAYSGTPSRAATAQYTYAFAGWTPEVVSVTEDASYTATYSETVNKYTVTWVNEDGSVLATETYEYGSTPVYPNSTPTKEATAQYTYTFAGWDKELVTVTGDVTYTATFTSTVNKYTVTWVNEDGSVLATETYEYGSTPTYKGETPTKEATAQYTYTFAAWDKELVTVTGDVTYTATFTSTVNKYTVTWVNEDGSVLATETYEYGSTPVYPNSTPTKEATAQYTYTFAGWDKELVTVTGDVTYTATFTSTVNKYTVTWVNEDGSVLATETYEYGSTPVYPNSTPTKEATAQYTYTFAGWDKELVTVTGDVTYTATFTSTVNKYTVTWVNEDGSVLATETYEYGSTPTYKGETPTKEATAQYTYTFAGWDKELVTVTGDVTYTATFTSTVNKYTVTWVNEDGSVLATETYEYGSTPAYKGETPFKDATLYSTYTFAGWDKELVTVTGDVTYTAVFETVARTGWVEFEGNTYFFDENHNLVKGISEVTDPDGNDKRYYEFDSETGVLIGTVEGIRELPEDGNIYLFEDGKIIEYTGLYKLVKEDGEINYYYFDDEHKALRGVAGNDHFVVENNNGLRLPEGINYTFGEDGVIKHFDDTSINGFYDDPASGNKYYCIDGVIIANGLMLIDGYYYYARTSTGALIVNRDYWISITHDLLPEGVYTFNELGQIVLPDQPEVPDVKNGIVAEDGSLYYYVDGERTGAGLIKIGDDYYYVRTSTAEVVHGRSYWITVTNGLLPEGIYEFDETGKMINPPVTETPDPEEPELKNGIVAEDGSLYYYVDGVRTGAGLIQIDGDYYYVRTSTAEVIHGRSYWITVTNGLLPEGVYQFADDGKMVR